MPERQEGYFELPEMTFCGEFWALDFGEGRRLSRTTLFVVERGANDLKLHRQAGGKHGEVLTLTCVLIFIPEHCCPRMKPIS